MRTGRSLEVKSTERGGEGGSLKDARQNVVECRRGAIDGVGGGDVTKGGENPSDEPRGEALAGQMLS